MPLRVAIDELSSALTLVQISTHLALTGADPEQMRSALLLITQICRDTDETVADVLNSAMMQMAHAADSHQNIQASRTD